MKKQSLIAILTFAALSGAALAAPETFIIDGSHTFPRFSYSHLGFSKQLSRFDRTSGSANRIDALFQFSF